MATTKATTLAHTLGGISSDISTAEINRLDGVTGDLQTQLDAKAPLASPTFTGTVAGITKAHVGLGNVDNVADASQTSLGTVTSGTFNGTIGSSATLAEGGLFKCIKNYHCGASINPGSVVGTPSTPWTKKSGGSQSWVDIGTDFTVHGGTELQFPVTGIWQITYYYYFFKQASSMGRNMECTPHIYNGTSWYGLDYIRVGENYDGSDYTRGGGSKTVMINVTNTNFRTAIYNNADFSSNSIWAGGEITFLCLSNT